jgi:hypothetical protein
MTGAYKKSVGKAVMAGEGGPPEPMVGRGAGCVIQSRDNREGRSGRASLGDRGLPYAICCGELILPADQDILRALVSGCRA